MTISQSNPGQLRPPGDAEGPIVQVGPARRREAIERLVGSSRETSRAASDRFLHFAQANAVRLDGLWSRLGPDGSITASVLAVPSPGRTAMVFATHPAADGDVPAIGGLIDHACRAVRAWDVHLAQVLLDPGEVRERRAFLDGGFEDLACLSYMERSIERHETGEAPSFPAGAAVEPYRDSLHGALAEALEASYRQTLDCPGLYGLRLTSDIIAGHRATGEFVPGLWTLLRLENRPVGALLLNPFPTHRTVELVYLGLAPEARRRGLGRRLLRHGFWLLRGRRERTLTLAVDQRNQPALALYRSEGLRPVVERLALIRPIRKS